MTPSGPINTTVSKTRRNPWLPLLVTIGLLLAFFAIDRYVKRASFAGYVPGEATLIASAQNLSAFWGALSRGEVAERYRAEVAFPLDNWTLRIRKNAGVRPTPLRWRGWLGRSFAAARTENGDTGICVHPGMLLRALSTLHSGWISEAPHTFHAYHYAWRDGFLIVSESRAYVTAALQPGASRIDLPHDSGALTVAWKGDSPGYAVIHPSPGLPVRGEMEFSLLPPVHPLRLTNLWNDPPMIAIVSADPRILLEEFRKQIANLPLTEGVLYSLDAIDAALPEGWADDGGEFALALYGIDTDQPIPTPDLAFALSGVDDLTPLPGQAINYEWRGNPGWIRPWAGNDFAICVTNDLGLRYITNTQARMTRFAGSRPKGPDVLSGLVITVQWDTLADAISRLCLRAAREELLIGLNAQDAEINLLPYIEAARNLGILHIEAATDDATLAFSGFLAKAPLNPATP